MPFTSGLISKKSQPIEVGTTGTLKTINISHNFERTPHVRYIAPDGRRGMISWRELDELTVQVDGPLPPNGKIIIE